ncbi:MAG: hypothetical protein AB8B50_19135 [Pirellulaceae bacterium]
MRLRLSLLALLVCLYLNPAKAEDLVREYSNGPVRVTTTLSPAEPTIGDELQLTIQATAEEQVELLMPEFGEVISGFQISEWLPREKILPDGSTQASVTIKFQVSISGEQSIAPILVEFIDNRPGRDATPEDMAAFEVETERIDFAVKSVLPKEAARDLRPPMDELLPPEERRNLWYLGAAVAVAITVLAATAYWLIKQRGVQVRRANAYDIAMQRLRPLLSQSSSGKVGAEQFFVEISDVVRRYLEDRFELRAPELTTDEFLQLASEKSGLSREHQHLLSEFLSQADVIKFAGVQASSQDIQRSSDLAMRFLEDTRADAPDVELRENPNGGVDREPPHGGRPALPDLAGTDAPPANAPANATGNATGNATQGTRSGGVA